MSEKKTFFFVSIKRNDILYFQKNENGFCLFDNLAKFQNYKRLSTVLRINVNLIIIIFIDLNVPVCTTFLSIFNVFIISFFFPPLPLGKMPTGTLLAKHSQNVCKMSTNKIFITEDRST